MKKKDILIILISVFIFVIFWIGFNIYHNSAKSTISESINLQIAPISPNFDTKTIENLKKRQNITPIYQINSAPEAPNLVTPVIVPLLNSSGSASQATSGGSLSQ